MEDFKIILMGFGNVGQALAKMLLEKREEVQSNFGRNILVTGVATGSHGCLYNPNGVDLKKALESIGEGGFNEANPDFAEDGGDAILFYGDYDALVELSPLNIHSAQPATERIAKAMRMGRHAISANKGPEALYFKELEKLAGERGVKFLYESTVMDGTPIFNLNEHCLKLCKVIEIEGILNTTTNFILEKLERGASYEEALEEGQRLGFVEADPSMDTDGWDATAKICVLANVLMDARLSPERVERRGIAGIDKAALDDARSRGKCVKLVCRAHRDESGAVRARVMPEEIDEMSVYANVSGASSVISITTDLMGKLTIIEHDPTIVQTAYGVFHDILQLL